MDNLENLNWHAANIRGRIVGLSHKGRIPHLASALSCVDVLVAAYWGGSLKITKDNVEKSSRDRFILSKGHAATAVYATLVENGILEEDTFWETGGLDAALAEQPAPGCTPGMEWATGSLGHGLSAGIGMALASRIQQNPFRVMVLVSDGECNEGSTWEAAMFAPAHKLTNLMVVVDSNKWQATGRSADILALHPIREKFEAFGWYAVELDGHDLPALVDAMQGFDRGDGRPTAIIANTVKGKGVSFMEDDNNWHYRTPTEDEVEQAQQELGLSVGQG
jgi:transketolase